MGSKKKCIGLSIFLLVFLLGLSTTSYASIDSADELKNFIFNAYAKNYSTGEIDETRAATVSNYISSHGQDIQQAFNDMQTYTGYVIPAARGNTVNVNSVRVMLTNNKFYSAGDGNYIQGINKSYNFNINNGTFASSTSSSFSGFSGTWNVYSSNVPVYVDTSYTTIRHEAGDYPSSFLDGDYTVPPDPELYFVPISPLGYRDFTVGQNLGLVVRGVTKNNTYSSMKFGDLYVPSYYYIKDIEVVWYYYNKNTGNWLGKYMLHEYGDDLTPDNYRSTIFNFKFEESFKDNDTTIVHYSLWGNRNYVLENCVYQFEIQSTKFKDGLLEFDGNAFYILDNNTVIGENGVLDTGFLDTGPYSDEYLNDVNDVAKKVDELDDLINGVETGVGNLLIPASGDWFPLNQLASGDDLLNTALGWGFKNYDNPYWTALYGLMNNILTTLTQTGNVEITFTLNGNNYTYNSNYVRLPDGPLKTWISLATTFLFVVAIYRLFNRKLEKIKMADSTVLKYSAEDSNLL